VPIEAAVTEPEPIEAAVTEPVPAKTTSPMEAAATSGHGRHRISLFLNTQVDAGKGLRRRGNGKRDK
jgi:hypothetical protein